MSHKDNRTANLIMAFGLIFLVTVLSCMCMKSSTNNTNSCSTKKSSRVKWPWIPDNFNGPIYPAQPPYLSGSDEEPPNQIVDSPTYLIKNKYQCPCVKSGCWSGCPRGHHHHRSCPYYHHSQRAGAQQYKWGAYYLDGSPYSPEGYPDYTKEATIRANMMPRSASRLGAPVSFSPIESCRVGYDYGVYNANGCIPYWSGEQGPVSMIDYR